jgi:hypothetical protein
MYLPLVPLSLSRSVKGLTMPAPARNTIDQDLTVVRRMKDSCVSDGMRGRESIETEEVKKEHELRLLVFSIICHVYFPAAFLL